MSKISMSGPVWRDRRPYIKPPDVYQDTDELLADLGLDAEPQGATSEGRHPEVPRPSNRTGTGQG